MSNTSEPEKRILITGSTGTVGMYLSLFFARQGIADVLYLGSREIHRAATVLHNAKVAALMKGFDPKIEAVECDLVNAEKTAELLSRIRPTLIINSAALLSLYPFFPALRKRQSRMNFVAGFGHTLPKDIAVLWPLMRAVKEVCPETPVVNLAAPDTAHAILKGRDLSPMIGAGTIDSSVQGVRLAAARKMNVAPGLVDVRLICHHAIRRFSIDDVPFFLQIFCDKTDLTEQLDPKALLSEAVDVSGVETMTTPVSTNAPITAASAAATAGAVLLDEGVIRHCAGIEGLAGGYPVRLKMKQAEPVLPEGIGMAEAVRINEAGMKMTGVERIEENGTVTFTDRERYWIQEGMGLSWTEMHLEDALEMSEELRMAYQRLYKEETA